MLAQRILRPLHLHLLILSSLLYTIHTFKPMCNENPPSAHQPPTCARALIIIISSYLRSIVLLNLMVSGSMAGGCVWGGGLLGSAARPAPRLTRPALGASGTLGLRPRSHLRACNVWAGCTRRPAPGTQDPKYIPRDCDRCHRPACFFFAKESHQKSKTAKNDVPDRIPCFPTSYRVCYLKVYELVHSKSIFL